MVAVVVAPLLALGTSVSAEPAAARDIQLLEGLDRWVRGLAATLSTGRSVTDSIRMSRRTAPPIIADEVAMLTSRLDNRWDTREALQRFADDLDSADADPVVAALMLAADRGAVGASTTLRELAESIQDQLKGRRLIETERSKPYVVVRQVTVITMITLVGVFALSPGFFAAYRTPVGQVVLSVLIVCYIASLVLLRRRAKQPPRDRILIKAAGKRMTLDDPAGRHAHARRPGGGRCRPVPAPPRLQPALDRPRLRPGPRWTPADHSSPAGSRSERSGVRSSTGARPSR